MYVQYFTLGVNWQEKLCWLSTVEVATHSPLYCGLGSRSTRVFAMELASFNLQKQLQVGTDVYVFKLGCNCDTSALAAATSENVVCLFEPSTMVAVRSLEGHKDNVSDVVFSQATPA
eukprot:3449326-Amphidinium_carterae.1